MDGLNSELVNLMVQYILNLTKIGLYEFLSVIIIKLLDQEFVCPKS